MPDLELSGPQPEVMRSRLLTLDRRVRASPCDDQLHASLLLIGAALADPLLLG
jgi:hypothetical protein